MIKTVKTVHKSREDFDAFTKYHGHFGKDAPIVKCGPAIFHGHTIMNDGKLCEQMKQWMFSLGIVDI